MSHIVTDSKEIAKSIKGQKAPFKCPACTKQYKSLAGILYHIGQFGPPSEVPRCQTNEENLQGSSKSTKSVTPPPTSTTATPVASLIASHPSSPVSSVGGVTASGRRRPRRELTWGETQRLVEVEFDNNYRRVEIDYDLNVSDEERQPVAEEVTSSGRRGGANSRTPQKRGLGTPVPNKTPSRGGSGGKPAKLPTVKDKCKRRSKLKSKNEVITLPKAEVNVVDGLEFSDAPVRESSYYRFVEQSAEDLDENVEYDMDEEDYQWLSLMNEDRKSQGLTSVPQEVFEILMDRLEKECVFESQSFADGDDASGKNMYNIDENAVCCICNDGECHNTNAILFCDMCNLAVHQECYGVPYIPEGQWLCRRCIESPSRGVDCALCPNKGGAFKRTLDARWAHVICAIWIPEVQFANPVFLEPIDGIKEIPSARWKLTCYICRRRMGACIQCAKSNCCTAFHVTCAQQACLHMKIEPAKGGTVKKIAYCDAHTPPSVKRKMEKAAREQEKKEMLEAKEKGSKDGDGNSGKGSEGRKDGMDEGEKKNGEDADEIDVGGGKEAASVDGSKKSKEGEGNDDSDDDAKPHRTVSSNVLKARKMMEEKRGQSNVPVVNIPFVPQHRLDHIISQVSVMKKSQFIPKLVNYWKLKRQSRNGVPLLRRLQASKGHRAAATNLTEQERSILVDQLALWNALRHDLERARLLIELVRKREKLKREQIRLLTMIGELQIRPLNFILRKALDRIARKDPAQIFANPVSVEDVPDYLDIIRKPMDFSTMRKKLDTNLYTRLEDFEEDFKLVWHNATIYNQKDTIYYKAAIRIKEAGQKVLEQAKIQVATAGIHCKTGLHHPDVDEPHTEAAVSSGGANIKLAQPINILEMNDESMLDNFRERRISTTSQISLEEQIDFLQEKLQMLQGHNNKRKEKALRKELSILRRQQKQHERKASEEDHSSAGSPRRHRAPSIPRNGEELASYLIHGGLRFTPSRQQILSYSGIRLEERASALKKEEALASRGNFATPSGNEHGRLHSSSDSMLLLNDRKQEHRNNRRKTRGRSSEPMLQGVTSDDDYKSALSSPSEKEEEEDEEVEEEEEVVILPKNRKRAREPEEQKRRKLKKRRKERHKDDQEDDKEDDIPVFIEDTPSSTLNIPPSSSRSRRHDRVAPLTRTSSQGKPPKSEPTPESTRKDVIGRRKRKVWAEYEEDEDNEDYDEQGVDDEKDLSFTIGRPKSRNRKKKVPPSPARPKGQQKHHGHQTRSRLKSSDTVTTESEVESGRPDVNRGVNGNDVKPRKSNRLNALRSSSIEESDSGPLVVGMRRGERRRSQSSSVYETAGEADFSEVENRRRSKQKKNWRQHLCPSDSENRDVFSESVTSPPSAAGLKDLTLHMNETRSGSNNSDSSRWDQEHKNRSNKRKRSPDTNHPSATKKMRVNSDGSEGGRKSKAAGMLNGLVVNGERGGMGDEIRPMELVWAKCRGYPPYPALVINPDIPECGINVRGEKILPPSDEVMELKEKNPTSTYLVRFFDGRRTWQCLPPEKIEPLGISQESDNAKIAMAGSSKRSVKEAFLRAKQWLQRKDKKGMTRSKSNSHDSETSHGNSVDSDSNVDLEA